MLQHTKVDRARAWTRASCRFGSQVQVFGVCVVDAEIVLHCVVAGKGKVGGIGGGSPPPFSNDRTLRVTPRGKRAVFKKRASTHTNARAM